MKYNRIISNLAIIAALALLLYTILNKALHDLDFKDTNTDSAEFKKEVDNNWKKRKYIKVPNRVDEEE